VRDFLVKDAVNFFTLAHFNCPPEFNPADFFLNVIWLDYKPKAAETGRRMIISLIAKRYEKVVDQYRDKIPEDSVSENNCTTQELAIFPNDPFTEIGLLLKRSWKQQSRHKLDEILNRLNFNLS